MKCDRCGKELEVGEWPFCGDIRNAHEKPALSKGFEAYYDEGLGEVIQTPGDRNKLLRPHWKDDYIVHIQPRDKSAQYYRELNERRRARSEAAKRERR